MMRSQLLAVFAAAGPGRCGSGASFVLAMLAGGLLWATSGAASAQTTGFDAKVLGHITRPSEGCPEGASLCGQAAIDGFGSAEYSFTITSFEPTCDACGDYTAAVTQATLPSRWMGRSV